MLAAKERIEHKDRRAVTEASRTGWLFPANMTSRLRSLQCYLPTSSRAAKLFWTAVASAARHRFGPARSLGKAAWRCASRRSPKRLVAAPPRYALALMQLRCLRSNVREAGGRQADFLAGKADADASRGRARLRPSLSVRSLPLSLRLGRKPSPYRGWHFPTGAKP